MGGGGGVAECALLNPNPLRGIQRFFWYSNPNTLWYTLFWWLCQTFMILTLIHCIQLWKYSCLRLSWSKGLVFRDNKDIEGLPPQIILLGGDGLYLFCAHIGGWALLGMGCEVSLRIHSVLVVLWWKKSSRSLPLAEFSLTISNSARGSALVAYFLFFACKEIFSCSHSWK